MFDMRMITRNNTHRRARTGCGECTRHAPEIIQALLWRTYQGAPLRDGKALRLIQLALLRMMLLQRCGGWKGRKGLLQSIRSAERRRKDRNRIGSTEEDRAYAHSLAGRESYAQFHVHTWTRRCSATGSRSETKNVVDTHTLSHTLSLALSLVPTHQRTNTRVTRAHPCSPRTYAYPRVRKYSVYTKIYKSR